MAAKKMSLKLVVDKEKNRVVFAESGSDFVDVLLSFLTMPIGTVMRLTGKESKIGGMSTLYESVEDLDVKILRTEACKQMLLKPISASEDHCRNLKVNVDDTVPTKYFSCSFDRCPQGYNYVSTSLYAQCLCGKFTTEQKVLDGKPNVGVYSNDGVFVKGNMRFIIRDHLEVLPVSMTATLTLLNELGIGDASVLEERSLIVGAAEVMSILNRILLSKTPLTDVFLRDQDRIDRENHDFKASTHHPRDLARPQEEKGNDSDSKKINVKLTVKKSDNKVVYAECGEQFAELLFSFLAFPLGVVTKIFGGDSGIRCLDNLHKSVQVLKGFMKSEECRGFLADPILNRYFSCRNQPLRVREQCPLPQMKQSVTIGWKQYIIINPKYPEAVEELGGSFIAGPAMFLVTDDLNVKQHSPVLGISLVKNLNIPISDLEEHVFSVGKKEAASLLLASLISKTVLTDVFYPKKPKDSKILKTEV